MKEGRGMGSGKDYTPYIHATDFPSKGQITRVRGLTDGRIHHLLSREEQDMFLILDYDPEVTEIREQYPLNVWDTERIAAMLHIDYPMADNWPVTMTTDFYYCRAGAWHAIAVKTENQLGNQRTKDKLKIEEEYWKAKNTPWELRTEKNINRTRAENIRWLIGGESIEKLIPSESRREAIESAFLDVLADRSFLFRDIIDVFEEDLGLTDGTILQLFKHLVNTGVLTLDLDKPIYPDDPRRTLKEGL